MSTLNSPDVLIVGAGPVGLVSALVLAQNGVAVRIIDKNADFAVGQRGAGVAPRTQEAFKFLGILDDILAAGAGKVNNVREYAVDGKSIKDSLVMDPQAATAEVPYPMFFHLGQDSTTAVLRTHLAKHGVSVELETELIALEQDGTGVSATLKTAAGEERVRAKYGVGADGGQGPTRKLVGAKFLGESHRDIRMIIGDVQLTGLDSEHWHRFKPEKGTIAVRPIPERPGFFFIAVLGPELDIPRAAADLDYLNDYIRRITKHGDITIQNAAGLREWSLNVRMADTFRVGRVLLAGDAAHVHSPTGGQGMNSGVMDAMNLGWKLALASKSLASSSLLDTYTAERLPVIREMLQYTSQLAWATFNSPSKEASAASESAFRRPLIGRQLGVHCRWSNIVLDELKDSGDVTQTAFVEPPSAYGADAGDRLHAGDRAPSAHGYVDGVQTTLFDVFVPTRHTVLVLVPEVLDNVRAALAGFPPGIARVLAVQQQQASGVADTFVDTEGSAVRAYGKDSGVQVAIVRPDGVVGGLLVGIAGVERYFSGVFGKSA